MSKNYKPKEFAELLGVSVITLQRWDNAGKLKAFRTLQQTEDITLMNNILSTKVFIKKIIIEKLLFIQEFQLLIKKMI